MTAGTSMDYLQDDKKTINTSAIDDATWRSRNIHQHYIFMRETMLFVHFIGLAMGLGVSFAHAFLGAAVAKMSPDEALKFRLHTLSLGRMGHIGMGLLLISGFYLITPYWSVLPSSPLLILKLSLVVVLIILIGLIGVYSKRAKLGDAESQFKKMASLGKFTLIIALAIVVLAVNVFH
jgi:uncharacterized membrane protein